MPLDPKTITVFLDASSSGKSRAAHATPLAQTLRRASSWREWAECFEQNAVIALDRPIVGVPAYSRGARQEGTLGIRMSPSRVRRSGASAITRLTMDKG